MTAALDDRLTGVNADGQMTPISGETIDNNSRQLTAAAPYWTPGQRQAHIELCGGEGRTSPEIGA